VPAIHRAVGRTLRLRVRTIVVDVNAVTHMDAACIDALLDAEKTAADAGVDFQVGPPVQDTA
jgi:anti-anti-sigma regulatory factor